MPESITVSLPRRMSLVKRISEASKQIVEWLQSFDIPFDDEKNRLQLTKCEHGDRGYSYQYCIVNRKGLSASDVTIEGNHSRRLERSVMSSVESLTEIPEMGG